MNPRPFRSGRLVSRQGGADAPKDAAQLWRRIVFNILISNTDDHLRNHGFLRAPDGWRLSPAYDLNPMPVDVKPRAHALALNETDQDASLDTALSVASYFRLDKARADAIARDVGRGGRLARHSSLAQPHAQPDRPDGQRLRTR